MNLNSHRISANTVEYLVNNPAVEFDPYIHTV